MPEPVLIVDDDPDFAEAVKMTLDAYGIDAEIAGNGREALDAIATSMPSVIILDMLMPVMDGWEFARRFHDTYGKATPIIVLSAAENARARAAEIGADAVLQKPFQAAKLIATIKRLAPSDPASAHV